MEFRAATAISGGLHAAVLLWTLVSFSGHRLEATPVDSLPVDLVSEKDFSQMTQGVKKAPKLEMPKPLVEKIAEAKPVEDPAPKITEKAEIKADGAENAGAATAAQAGPDRRETQEAGRAEAGQGRAAAAAAEEAGPSAAEIRRRQDRRAARQARSAAQRRGRGEPFHAVTRHGARQRRPSFRNRSSMRCARA